MKIFLNLSNHNAKVEWTHSFFQPVRFCNLNHESVFRKIFALLFLEALIPPTVDLIYTHGRSHNHNDCPRIMDVVLGSVILSFPRCWGGRRKKQYFLGLKVVTKNSTYVSQDYFFLKFSKIFHPKKFYCYSMYLKFQEFITCGDHSQSCLFLYKIKFQRRLPSSKIFSAIIIPFSGIWTSTYW